MKKFLKPLAVLVCTVALVAGTVAATLAYLKVETAPITNTFVAGDINITLTESANLDLKMVPGTTIEKDPTVTVEAGSEACWLFVKLDESTNFATYLEYDIAAGWTALDAENGVYYRQVDETTLDTTFQVLAEDKVTVNNVTKADYNDIGEDETPTLTVTAYAIQHAGFAVDEGEQPTDAWNEIYGISQS